jgi:hypothetical protein
LREVSYARPGKLSTAHRSLAVEQIGVLKNAALKQVIEAVVKLLRKSIEE